MVRRSQQKKKSGGDGAGASSSSGLSSSFEELSVKQDETTQKYPTPPPPHYSWASELKLAGKAYKKQPANIDTIIRYLKCLVIMRRWEEGREVVRESKSLFQKHTDTTASTNETDNNMVTKEKQREYQDLVAQLKSITPKEPMSKDDKEFCKSVRFGGADPDTMSFAQMTFCNLGPLYFAGIHGMVDFFENIVALGASIDYEPLPVDKIKHHFTPDDFTKAVVPASSTPLLLLCASLAMDAEVPDKVFNGIFKQQMEGQAEIAVQLVRLGADTSAVFDANHGPSHFMTTVYNQMGFHGKTAFQLALMSHRKELIEVMKEFHENRAVLKEKVQCRCGSRLPLKICHGCHFDEELHLMDVRADRRINFRYSPLARCPCKKTSKTYYDCCWDGAAVSYNNDRTGGLYGFHRAAITPEMQPAVEFMNARKQEWVARGADPQNAKMFPEWAGKSPQEMAKKMADVIRSDRDFVNLTFHGPTSKNRQFDLDVYAGCVERLDNFFFWRDDHWRLDKPELLVRGKEWNTALEQYCDAEGLTGDIREQVLALHRASPHAPCSNPTCDAVESKVKDFKLCSRCRCVAYCSRECQGKHWKGGHKKVCGGNIV